MEAASQPVTQPLSDVDRKILGIMDTLGWGVTCSKLAEYADLDTDTVQSSLKWMAQKELVRAKRNDDLGLLFWYRHERAEVHDSLTFCPICGERCKNVHGLAIHQARKHQEKPKPQTVWIDSSVESSEPEKFDYMSMDVEPRTMNFVQDIIKRFADLPGVSIRVTVEFKGAGA